MPSSPPTPFTKAELIAAVLASLEAELAAIERVAAMARDEATSEETRSEGKYDTRATEASYLARGQARRIADLRALCEWFRQLTPHRTESVALGSLVELAGPRPGMVLLAPTGGPTIEMGGWPVRVISPDSPLGQAIWEAEEGDSVELEGPQGIAIYRVQTIR